ncbi:hypothetical protein [Pyruvatibacter mobilis]|jgi:hypothetical protein|uniref:hypothetical protein n=1 Tax=Pyruvatibacter mobilis TaxID=1712261 RepID=UPI003C7E26CA
MKKSFEGAHQKDRHPREYRPARHHVRRLREQTADHEIMLASSGGFFKDKKDA